MKKLLLLFAILGFVGVQSVSAQCDKSKHAKVEKSCHGDKAAVKAAALDDNIEQRLDEETGKVSFVKKSVCEKSGKVSYTAVQYSEAEAKFVDLPAEGKTGCAGKAAADKKAGCCASKAKATAAAGDKKAGCCAGKAGKAASCSKKKEGGKAAVGKVKLVKEDGA